MVLSMLEHICFQPFHKILHYKNNNNTYTLAALLRNIITYFIMESFGIIQKVYIQRFYQYIFICIWILKLVIKYLVYDKKGFGLKIWKELHGMKRSIKGFGAKSDMVGELKSGAKVGAVKDLNKKMGWKFKWRKRKRWSKNILYEQGNLIHLHLQFIIYQPIHHNFWSVQG